MRGGRRLVGPGYRLQWHSSWSAGRLECSRDLVQMSSQPLCTHNGQAPERYALNTWSLSPIWRTAQQSTTAHSGVEGSGPVGRTILKHPSASCRLPKIRLLMSRKVHRKARQEYNLKVGVALRGGVQAIVGMSFRIKGSRRSLVEPRGCPFGQSRL